MVAAKVSIERYAVRTIKCLHAISNLILILAAAGMVYSSVVARIEPKSELKLLWYYETKNVDVILGFSILLIGIASVCIFSLIQSSMNGHLTGFVALLVFLLATINYAIATGVLTNYTERGPLFKQLHHELLHYEKHTKDVDDLQSMLSCCGVKSFADFSGALPSSCCKGKGKCDTTNQLIQTSGCFEPLRRLIVHYAWVIVIGLALLSIIEIIAMTTSFALFVTIREERRKAKEGIVKIPRVRSGTDDPEAPPEEQPKKEPKEEPPAEPLVEEPKEEPSEPK